MAVSYEEILKGLSLDPFTGEPLVLNKVRSLTVGHYQKWLRKQVRTFGRRAELGNAQLAPVEAFVREVTGLRYYLLAGGEVEVYVGNEKYEALGPQTLAYYLYEEEDVVEGGVLITKAGRALDMAMLENPSLPLAA